MPLPSIHGLQIASLALGIVGFVAGFVALLTPAWQVVYARELQQWIQSGLWLNCQTRPSGMYTCTYTFSESDFDFYTNAESLHLRTPPFYAWQRRLLYVFLVAQFCTFLSFVSFCCAFLPTTSALSAFCCTAATGLSVLLHSIGLVAFSVFSQMVEYRFYHVSVSGIYEKHRGYSFYVELLATLMLAGSLILSIAYVLVRHGGATSRKSTKYTGPLAGGLPYRDGIPYDGLDPYECQFAMRDLPPPPGRGR